jgi:sugar-phosphatase
MPQTISIQTDALLFDMDGVLIDSTPAVARVWTQWALAHGFDPAAVVRRAQGRPSLTTIRELLPDSDHRAENAKVERSEIEDLEGVVPLPGTLELLSRLPSERWAIVTSSTRPLAEVRLRAAGLPQPALIITSNDVTHGKPHPEPYLKAAESLRFPSANCIAIEDAPAGIKAGKGAGSRVIAFPTTLPVLELQKVGPDWIVANCSALTLQSVNGRMTFQLKELRPNKAWTPGNSDDHVLEN